MNDPTTNGSAVGRISFGSPDNPWGLRDLLVIAAGLILHALALAIFLRWARKQ